MKIVVTGGCGYVGSVLVNRLLGEGHEVRVIDLEWFGNYLSESPLLEVVSKDVRAVEVSDLQGFEAVIHLANVANDPGVELDPTLSWEINALGSQRLADKAARAGVSHFLFASSGSVYGIKQEAQVTEDLDLVPISTYNKTKMVAERAVLSYSGAMKVHCIRPATVCGISPRMRLDVSVNMFVKQAHFEERITVFGGAQVRPNIHIDDLVDVYIHFLKNPGLPQGAYNAGFENISILEIAQMVHEQTSAEIVVTDSNDPRSYRQNSDKLVATGFVPKKSVKVAIEEILHGFREGTIKDRDEWYTVGWMTSSLIRTESNGG